MTKTEAEAIYQQRLAEYQAACAAEGAIYPRKDPQLTAAASKAHAAWSKAFFAVLRAK